MNLAAAAAKMFSRQALLVAGFSGAVTAVGDVLGQAIRAQAAGNPMRSWAALDKHETARFALVGATLKVPFLYVSMGIDELQGVGGGKLRQAVVKSSLGQVAVLPIYVVSFLIYMGLLQGRSLRECIARAESAAPQLFLTGAMFWWPVNVVKLLAVPLQQRLPFMVAAGWTWSCALSYAHSHATRHLVEDLNLSAAGAPAAATPGTNVSTNAAAR